MSGETLRSVARRCWIGPVALVLVAVLPGGASRAEILPTKGTFRGIYHVNRAGVGRMDFFIFHAKLKPRMAQCDGKCISVQILKGRQPINPGPVVVDEIGEVEMLPSPALRAEIETIVPGASGPETLDVLCAFRNTSKTTVRLRGYDVGLSVLSGPPEPVPDQPDFFLKAGYTTSQYCFRGLPAQPSSGLEAPGPGDSARYQSDSTHIEPGQSVPFVWHSLKLRPGKHELAVSASYYLRGPKIHVPVKAWTPLDVPMAKTTARPRSRLAAHATITRRDEWLSVAARVAHLADQPRHLFVKQQRDLLRLPGQVRAQDKDGRALPIRVDWTSPNAPWVRRAVDRRGLDFRFRLRLSDFFSEAHPARITLWTVTDGGLERLTLAEHLSAPPQRPMPPWGARVRGCRSRIRAARERFKPGERIRFFLQAESDGTEADMLWLDKGHGASHVRVEIDGAPVLTDGRPLSDEHVHPFPFQRELYTARRLGLAPGRHRLKLVVTGDGGVYTNLKGKQYRKLDGTLISNEVEFEVAE